MTLFGNEGGGGQIRMPSQRRPPVRQMAFILPEYLWYLTLNLFLHHRHHHMHTHVTATSVPSD